MPATPLTDVARRLLVNVENDHGELASGIMHLPTSNYTDAAQYQREMETIFRKVPLVTALSVDIPNTGDYRAMDIAGRSVFLNLSTTPHLLVAGATGAGKSSGINCIITSLLMRTTPDQVRLILVDPKQVEMGQYAKLPHLLTAPVTNPKKAANALAWAVDEMERRYEMLAQLGFRDITGYNAAFDRGELQPEPGAASDTTYQRLEYIVVVVDELNDLMMVAQRDVEESITRIAQKARAVLDAVIGAARAGVSAADLDRKRKEALGSSREHAITAGCSGIGIGLSAEEAPRLTAASGDVLREGDVCSLRVGCSRRRRRGWRRRRSRSCATRRACARRSWTTAPACW